MHPACIAADILCSNAHTRLTGYWLGAVTLPVQSRTAPSEMRAGVC